MNAPINVRRLLRIATFLACASVACLVYFAFAPQVDAAADRLDGAQSQLRSDEIAFSEMPRLRARDTQLTERYAKLFAMNPEAVFLRSLATDATRHDVTLVATTETHEIAQVSASTLGPNSPGDAYDHVLLNVELRGPYRNLLAAIGQLSLGQEIVRVDTPTLRRDGDAVIANVPVAIFEPTTRSAPAEPRR